MFQKTAPTNHASSAVSILELIYHNTVRSVRKAHGNAFMSIAVSVFQSLLFVLFFYIMFSIMGLIPRAAIIDPLSPNLWFRLT